MLSSSEISHIAKLAKLKLEPEERESLAKELSRVLDYVGVLDRVDTAERSRVQSTSSEAPQSHEVSREAHGEVESLRDDVVRRPGIPVGPLLGNAPESLDRFVLVPAIK